MINKKINICGTNVHPGEIANLALPLPEQYSCAPLYMPIKVINGSKSGPCLVVFSGLRGNELNGLEIANRVIKLIDPNQVSGTVITIPVMNVYGLWIIAHKGGILHSKVNLGQTIDNGDIIGTISDPFGADLVEQIRSFQKGVVVGINTAPLIHEGLAIFKIASFLDDDKAETIIEEWDKKKPDSYIG